MLSTSNRVYDNLEKYYDIDGISFILSTRRFSRISENAGSFPIDIHNKGKYSPRIMNSCKISYKNLGILKKLPHIFLTEICTFIGRINIFAIFQFNGFNINDFINMAKSYSEFEYDSFFISNELEFKLTGISLDGLFNIFNELEEKYNGKIYLYGEKYGNKYKMPSKSYLHEFLNYEFRIFEIPLFKLSYFEIDICKNILRITRNQDHYTTNVFLRNHSVKNINYLTILSEKPVHEYNVLNSSSYNDYHCNNSNIPLFDASISILKINLYNPITNHLFNDLYKKDEMYNKKFMHEVLFSSNNIRLSSN